MEPLTATVLDNLCEQHDWTNIETVGGSSNAKLARPLLRGLPPRLLYLHPDDQKAAIEHQRAASEAPPASEPELEWVLPMHVSEKFTIAGLASVFDTITSPVRRAGDETGALEATVKLAAKRLLLAIVNPDSTVVYYLLHEGIVKPRQN